MTRIAGEVTINAPVQEVFDLVADERNEPLHNPRLTRVEMAPRRLRNNVRSSSMKIDGTLTFDEVGDATRLRRDWDMDLVGPVRILSPVLALVGPRWERRNWDDLKHYLERRR